MRNRTFDLFKWAAALFVLLLHVPFPGDVGGTVRMFARWAVPFFFMVSGYFTYGAVQREDAGRLLLVVPLVLGEVVVGMLHREVAAQYSRNAWFTGLPCFALGLLFKEAETQIKRLGRKWPALGVLVGLALSVLEYRYLNDSADLYLGPLVAAVSLFLLAQNVTCTWENPFVLYAEGSALAIYILHPALRNLAQRQLLPWWGVRGMAADWLLPVLTLALALLAAGIWLWLKGLWNQRKTRQVTA